MNQKEIKPKPYPNTDEKETRAVNIFNNLIDIDRVKSDVNIRDKYPNHDGFIELIDIKGFPCGKIFVQVKGLNDKKLNPPKIQIETTYFSYANIDNCPFILIGVDCINEKVYWYHIKRNIIDEVKNQKSKVITFPISNIIDGKNSDYIDEWDRIIKNDKKKIDFYDELKEENKRLIDLTRKAESSEIGIVKQEYKSIHIFLNVLNNLLETHFSVIKSKIYNNPWKIGLIYFRYEENSYGYSLFPIPWNKNDALIKLGNNELWEEIKNLGLGLKIFDDSNILHKNPTKFAKKILYDHLKLILNKQLLNNQCNDILAQEYVISFIDLFHKQLGLEIKEEYSLEEVFFGFFIYIPIWIDEVSKFIIEKKRNNTKKIEDLYFKRPYIRISTLDVMINLVEEMEIKKKVQTRIKNKDFNKNSFTIGSDNLSFLDFHKCLNFLMRNNITNIRRIYKRTGFVGEKKPQQVYDRFTEDDIESNIRAFFEYIEDVYIDFLNINFPYLINEFDLYRNFSKIIIIYEIDLSSSQMIGQSPISFDIYYLQKNGIKTRDFKLIPKNPEILKIFKGKQQGDQIIFNNETYFLKFHQWQVFSLIFGQTPMLKYCYQIIRERVREYFLDIINWYDELRRNFKLGKKLELDQIIQGLVIKNIYDFKNSINKLTIRTREGEVQVLLDGKGKGMIEIGQMLTIKGKFDSETKKIKEARILSEIN